MMKPEAYNRFPNKQMAPKYLPDFSIDSILDIDFEQLKQLGIKHILFDLDLTLRKTKAKEIEADIIAFLANAHQQGLIQSISLASNSLHNLKPFSEPLGARIFQPFYLRGRFIRKPRRAFFDRILQELDTDPSEVVMVGDKAMFDVAGGNSVGMWTILIKPQGRDLLHDKLLFIRSREKRLLRAARELAAKIQNT